MAAWRNGGRVDASRRRPGNPRARRVLSFADALAESPGESISRALFEIEGVPRPELHVEVRTAGGSFVGRGDFGWRGPRVIGEFDGAVKYDTLVGEGRRPSDVVMAESAGNRPCSTRAGG